MKKLLIMATLILVLIPDCVGIKESFDPHNIRKPYYGRIWSHYTSWDYLKNTFVSYCVLVEVPSSIASAKSTVRVPSTISTPSTVSLTKFSIEAITS